MNASVITVGKKRYLVGMSWRSFEKMPKRSGLIQMGQTMFRDGEGEILGAQWCAVRALSDEVVQAGFCRKPVDGSSYSKLVALAPLIASVRIEPWLGIFKIAENQWWYIAVRNGHTILPDGDAIGDRETIEALREQHSGYGDWNYVKGELKDLQELILDSQEKPSFAFPLDRRAALWASIWSSITPQQIVLGAGVLAIAAGGFWWKNDYDAHEAEMARQRDHERATAEKLKKLNLPPPPSLLAKEPMPDEWLNACLDTIAPTPMSQYGWSFSSFDCKAEGNVATRTWTRSDGAVASTRPDGLLSIDGNIVTESFPMVAVLNVKRNAGDKAPIERAALQAWAQGIGVVPTIDSTVAQSDRPRLPGQASAPPPAVRPTEESLGFSVTLPVEPRGLGLDLLPGVRVKSLSFDGKSWVVTGKLYSE